MTKQMPRELVTKTFANIAHIFFDYGGVLDSHGIHTRRLFWKAAVDAGLFEGKEAQRVEFQEAYTWADQELMRTGSALGMGLKDFNYHNISLILKALDLEAISEKKLENAATLVTESQEKCLKISREILQGIDLPKSLVSNFTGNLQDILREQGLRSLFTNVSESFHVGAAKPSLDIFLHALSSVDASPEECVFIGDNIENDMKPAKSLGMKTILYVTDYSGSKTPEVDLEINELGLLRDFFNGRS